MDPNVGAWLLSPDRNRSSDDTLDYQAVRFMQEHAADILSAAATWRTLFASLLPVKAAGNVRELGTRLLLQRNHTWFRKSRRYCSLGTDAMHWFWTMNSGRSPA